MLTSKKTFLLVSAMAIALSLQGCGTYVPEI